MDGRPPDEGGTDGLGTPQQGQFYVINYTFTLTDEGASLETGPDSGEGEGSGNNGAHHLYEGGATTFMFSPMMPFAMMARNKPRASERAVAALKRVSVENIPEAERSCPICYDEYDTNPDIDPITSLEFEKSTDNDKDRHGEEKGELSSTAAEDENSMADEADQSEAQHDLVSSSAAGPAPLVGNEESNQESVSEAATEEPPHIPVALPCGHRFGLKCIKEWLASSTTCPLCRQAIESEAEYLRATGQQPASDSQPMSFANVIMSVVPDILRQTNAIVRGFEQQQHQQQQREGSDGVHIGGHTAQRRDASINGTNGGIFTPGEQPPLAHFRLHWAFDDDTTSERNATPSSSSSTDTFSEQSHQADNDGDRAMPEARDTARDTAPGGAAFFVPEALRSLLRARRSPMRSSGVMRRFQLARPPTPAPASQNVESSSLSTEGLRSANREFRHHPYRASPSVSTAATPVQSQGRQEAASDEQCASLPLQICSRQADDSEEGRLVRLGCGHAYHAGCLRMSMRAHGDNQIGDFDDEFHTGTEAWCIRCRQYQHVTSTPNENTHA